MPNDAGWNWNLMFDERDEQWEYAAMGVGGDALWWWVTNEDGLCILCMDDADSDRNSHMVDGKADNAMDKARIMGDRSNGDISNPGAQWHRTINIMVAVAIRIIETMAQITTTSTTGLTSKPQTIIWADNLNNWSQRLVTTTDFNRQQLIKMNKLNWYFSPILSIFISKTKSATSSHNRSFQPLIANKRRIDKCSQQIASTENPTWTCSQQMILT